MWLTLVSLFCSFVAVSLSVYSFLSLPKKLERSDIRPLLESESESISRTLKAAIKQIETEWDDMYLKFSRLAGRVDRQRALENPKTESLPPEPAPPLTRADILKRWRSK